MAINFMSLNKYTQTVIKMVDFSNEERKFPRCLLPSPVPDAFACIHGLNRLRTSTPKVTKVVTVYFRATHSSSCEVAKVNLKQTDVT